MKQGTYRVLIVALLILSLVMPQFSFSRVSAGFETMPMICTGSDFSLVLKSDGTVWSWGRNFYGQLGNGTNSMSHTPGRVSLLEDVVSISGGASYALALKSDGTVWAWGRNDYGRLGNGTNNDSNLPVQVVNLDDVIKISTMSSHSYALKRDGTVWEWGGSIYGSVGNVPVQVRSLSNVIDISAGGGPHGLALKNDNTLWAWGVNHSGYLGDGTTTYRAVPVQTMTDVVAINGGAGHSLALKSDGTVWAWGRNAYGQLGDGSTTERSYPVQVSGLTNVKKISSGSQCSYALMSDGTLRAWGHNRWGKLGDGTVTNRHTPVQVSGLENVVLISRGGTSHALALESDGTLWSWGSNSYGNLGIGIFDLGNTWDMWNSNFSPVPVEVLITFEMPEGGAPLGKGKNNFAVSPTKPMVGQEVIFDASAFKVAKGRTIESYTWSFEAGANSYGEVVTHTFNEAGSYPVVLFVIDDAGNSYYAYTYLSVSSHPMRQQIEDFYETAVVQ